MSCLVLVLPNPLAPQSVSSRAPVFLTREFRFFLELLTRLSDHLLGLQAFSRVFKKCHLDLTPIIRIYYSRPNIDRISDGKP